MHIEVFSLAIGGGLDLDRKVADVHVSPQGIDIQCYDPGRQVRIDELFREDAIRFVAAGEGGDGVETFPAGSPEAIQHVLEDELYGYSLGGRIVAL